MRENRVNLFHIQSILRKLPLIGWIVITTYSVTACTKLEPQVIVVTATNTATVITSITDTPVTQAEDKISVEPVIVPTIAPSTSTYDLSTSTYVVEAGDTLSGIALKSGASINAILKLNQISDPDILTVGQVILLPSQPSQNSPNTGIIPDGLLVRGPKSNDFDLAQFVSDQRGYIRVATDIVDEQLLTATEVFRRVSVEYSVDPRLLLALLEYQSQWLTQFTVDENGKQFPIQRKPSQDGVDRSGLYKQLSWAANQLNYGYYGGKYNGYNFIEFDDGTRINVSNQINAGTVALQRFFSVQQDYQYWANAIEANAFLNVYENIFGRLVTESLNELFPKDIIQPELTFPFSQGQTWFFTGGPHGGWGSGSAWAAIDFAPPDDRPEGSSSCYVSDYWATSVSSGVIVRSDAGVVVLDIDGDGDETTGWTILYLHMASEGRIGIGTRVNIGDPIGKPSCEGGFSNATHMHIARRYNGEWIPVSCSSCTSDAMPPPFVMNGWTVIGLENQEYQGYMIKGDERRDAEQGRLTPINQVSW